MRLTVDLSWNANTEADLAGYIITWGDRSLLVQKDVTALTLSVLVKPKQVLEFKVWPFDMAGNLPKEGRTIKAVYVE